MRKSPFGEVGWYQHVCGYKMFAWGTPPMTVHGYVWCYACRRTNHDWVRLPGYDVLPAGQQLQRAYVEAIGSTGREAAIDAALPYMRAEVLNEVLTWLAGVDADLCAEMYTIISEGRRLDEKR